MIGIKIVSKYKINFRKNWSPSEIDLAECLLFEFDNGNIIVDIRRTSKKSLYEFIKKCFFSAFVNPTYKQFFTDFFAKIKVMYNNHFSNFNDSYLSDLYTNCKHDLFGFQKEDLALMAYRRCNLLSYEQGMGKTLTSATLSKALGTKRTVVIGPTLVKWNWFKNMTDEWGYNPLYWTILDRKKNQCIRAGILEKFVVINYEQVKNHMEYLSRDIVDHIIIDECHNIKNHTTGRYKGIEALVKKFPKARITLLSGTPIKNRSIDMFAYLKLCKHPLGRVQKAFKERYSVTSSTRGGKRVMGSKNNEDLRLRISNFMIRRRADQELDLPPLIINKYYIDTDELSDEYDKLMEELYERQQLSIKLETQGGTTEDKFKNSQEIRTNLMTLNKTMALAKCNKVCEFIDQLHEQGRKVVIFSGFTQPLEYLKSKYIDNSVLINGSVSAHKRQALIDRFLEDKDCNVFLGNFIAAGVGINLVNARDCIFLNFPFTPDDLEQPYKRIHRIGQKHSCNVYYTMAKDSIDEHLFAIIEDKIEDINKIVDNDSKGTIKYGNIPNLLMNSLLKDYKK